MMILTMITARKIFHQDFRDLSATDLKKKKILFLKCQLPYDKNHFRIYEGEIGN